MNKILYTEWLKTRRSPIRWIVFGAPIAYAAVFILYYSSASNSSFSMFQAFLGVWTTFCVPFGIGLLAAFIVHEEELAGNFNGFLGGNILRFNRYLGKLITLILFTTTATFISILIFSLWATFTRTQFPLMIFIKAGILSEIGSLPLIAINLWLSLWKGTGVSIGFGGIGVVIASFFAIIGDKYWQFIIWAWPVRLSLMQEFSISKNMLLKSLKPNFVLNQTIKGLIIAAICFIIILIASLIWFKNWEGRKTYD